MRLRQWFYHRWSLPRLLWFCARRRLHQALFEGSDKNNTAPKKKERVKIIIKKKKDKCADKEYEKGLDAAQLIVFTRECEKKKTEKKEE